MQATVTNLGGKMVNEIAKLEDSSSMGKLLIDSEKNQ